MISVVFLSGQTIINIGACLLIFSPKMIETYRQFSKNRRNLLEIPKLDQKFEKFLETWRMLEFLGELLPYEYLTTVQSPSRG